jgi:SAM-dependent methyltransferase
VDLSPELLERARARGLPSTVSFLEMPFEDCQPEGPFSAVIGNSVLHHLDLDTSLRRIRELLEPGGTLAFAEPNMLNPQIFLERRFPRWFPYVSPDETAFIRRRLAARLRRLGFVDVRIEPFDWLHPKTPARLIPPVQALGALLERLPVVRAFAGSLVISARSP